jgi:hypothetical protein
MKAAFALFLTATLAGCAAAPEPQLADAGCKVEPGMTANTVSKRAQPSELDRKWAEAQLRSTDYYRQSLARDQTSTVVQAARDCP